MATPSIADASWMFGMRDQEEEYQLQTNMHHHQLHQSPAEISSMATSAAPSTQKKKKRTHPDPDAQVIALSPKTLMAKNRFICEVCKKGFQREQNLQLHRRGHNLPWKLKQKSTKEVRKKVYLCPEPTCVHHHPSRALGDLTGIKKHFSRKHGEKKWKCDKCSKTYAVQSDWKAHSKTCGTKEYRCDCGTLFSRRDSFVTHQAFCDALAQENPTNMDAMTSQLFNPSRVLANQVSPHHLGLHFHESNFLAGHTGDGFRSFGSLLPPPLSGSAFPPAQTFASGSPNYHEEDQHPHSPTKFSVKWLMQQLPEHQIPSQHSDHIFFSNTAKKINCGEMGGSSAGFFSSDHNFMGDQISPVYSSAAPLQNLNPNNASASPHLSATALLQKAAQADSSCSINGSSSLLRSLGSSLSSSKQDLHASLGATSFGALLGDLGGGGSRTSRLFGGLEKDISGYNDNYQDNPNTCISEYATNEETKLRFGKFLEDEYSMVNIAGSDRLTRDFMGVGQLVGHMSGGGFSQTDLPQHQKGHQTSS